MYIFEYSELIKNLVSSDLKVKYSGSILGFAWSMLNPMMMMIVLYIVFSNVFKSQDNLVMYMLTGILTWRFFAIGTSVAMQSIVNKSTLITKIYIRREILTLCAVLSSLITSILEFLILIPLLLIFGSKISPTILIFPIIHLLFFMMIYGLGLILASLYVYFRDMSEIWEIVLQAGFFMSPIFYPLSYIPEKYMFYYMLNPITIFMVMYREILIEGVVPKISYFIFVTLIGLILLIAGTLIFNKLSHNFAEKI